MPVSPTDLLHEWRDFFIVVATVSATLIGAMFVVASIGIGFFNRSHAAAIRTFLTPTVIHLSGVVVMCLLTMVPALDWNWFAGGLGLAGIAGVVYSAFVAVDVWRRRELVLVDHFWYGGAPVFGHLGVLASAVLSYATMPHALAPAGIGMVLMIFVGVRNSWDMIVFILTQERRPSDPT